MAHGLFQKTLSGPRLRALLLLALAAAGLLSLPGEGRTAQDLPRDIARLNRFVQSGDSPAMLAFRQGRDFIEKEDWAGAAARFEGYVTQYPKGRDVDAALYWLAYALKKQRKFAAAEQTLGRLMREFPRSAWADDARAMEVEIAPQLGRSVDPGGIDDEEVKIVALQSLFQSDPARASAYVTDILKNPRASRELKEMAVSLLGQYGGTDAMRMLVEIARTQPDPGLRGVAVHRLGQFGDAAVEDLMRLYETEREDEVKEQILHAFSQIDGPRAYAKLLEVARGSGSTELRQTAIHWIGQRRDPQAVDELMRILSSDADDDVRGRVLHAFSQMDDPRAQARLLEVARGSNYSAELRTQAIHWLGQRGESSLDELMAVFRAERNEEVRHAVLHAFSQMSGPRARAALLEVARGGDDPEARAQAIHWLAQADDDASLDSLVKLYDAERDEEVKGSLLHAFSQSRQERALLKLMDVARADASREMRKQAIHWLGQSRDPRALKFLQDLLR